MIIHVTWWFPKIGVTPSYHPFLAWDFPMEINHPTIWVAPWPWFPPPFFTMNHNIHHHKSSLTIMTHHWKSSSGVFLWFSYGFLMVWGSPMDSTMVHFRRWDQGFRAAPGLAAHCVSPLRSRGIWESAAGAPWGNPLGKWQVKQQNHGGFCTFGCIFWGIHWRNPSSFSMRIQQTW